MAAFEYLVVASDLIAKAGRVGNLVRRPRLCKCRYLRRAASRVLLNPMRVNPSPALSSLMSLAILGSAPRSMRGLMGPSDNSRPPHLPPVLQEKALRSRSVSTRCRFSVASRSPAGFTPAPSRPRTAVTVPDTSGRLMTTSASGGFRCRVSAPDQKEPSRRGVGSSPDRCRRWRPVDARTVVLLFGKRSRRRNRRVNAAERSQVGDPPRFRTVEESENWFESINRCAAGRSISGRPGRPTPGIYTSKSTSRIMAPTVAGPKRRSCQMAKPFRASGVQCLSQHIEQRASPAITCAGTFREQVTPAAYERYWRRPS